MASSELVKCTFSKMGLWEERRTLVLVNLASIMEGADDVLLPAVYKEIGVAIHVTPTGLGSLTLFKSIVQGACSPLAAYMATRHNRAHVIALGAFFWAAATFLVGISTNFLQVAISRGLNGIGLALVIPAIQSLVVDSVDDEYRGSAFGWLRFSGFLGSIFGGLLPLSLASSTIMGIDGWRIAFYLVALISMVVGFLIWQFVLDPHFTNKGGGTGTHSLRLALALEEAKDVIKKAKAVMQVRSFQIIVTQGVTSYFPWASTSFMPLWFELIGFSHEYTGFLMSLFYFANLFGSLFGGMMGDFLARHFPNGGRIFLSQISSGSTIPLAAVLLLVLPDDPSTGFSHALVIFVMGLLFSWNDAATNYPIFAEIVPEESRTSIYALDRSFEYILGAFAVPVVGILAEHVYGYKIGDNDDGSDDPTINQENAASLAKALYTVIAIPMLFICSIYFFLYSTYPTDRERTQMYSQIAAEIVQQSESSDIQRNDIPQL